MRHGCRKSWDQKNRTHKCFDLAARKNVGRHANRGRLRSNSGRCEYSRCVSGGPRQPKVYCRIGSVMEHDVLGPPTGSILSAPIGKIERCDVGSKLIAGIRLTIEVGPHDAHSIWRAGIVLFFLCRRNFFGVHMAPAELGQRHTSALSQALRMTYQRCMGHSTLGSVKAEVFGTVA